MGNLLPVSVCPICDLDADDDDSVGHEFSHEQKFSVYREGANGVSFRSNLSSCKMIIPAQMLHGRQGLRVLGFEYRTVQSSTGGRGGTCTCRRLHHVATNEIITPSNSRIHIPNCLFSEVTRCCQDIAQDVLLKEGGLERLLVREEGDKIRTVALVTRRSDYDNATLETCSEDGSRSTASEENCRPTLLAISGRGHSRAGIFSRKQLLVSGIEAATALNTVKEARKRGMNVVLMDHYMYSQKDLNSQIDTMDAFEASLGAIFDNDQEQDGNPVGILLQIHLIPPEDQCLSSLTRRVVESLSFPCWKARQEDISFLVFAVSFLLTLHTTYNGALEFKEFGTCWSHKSVYTSDRMRFDPQAPGEMGMKHVERERKSTSIRFGSIDLEPLGRCGRGQQIILS